MEDIGFKPIQIEDKAVFNRFLRQDPPQISELTFTNLFIWRHRHRPCWLQRGDCLLIIFRPREEAPFGLPPIGPGDKKKALDHLFQELETLTPETRVCRVDKAFVEEHVNPDQYGVNLDRDNSDYVYKTRDLINLTGRKYHRKKKSPKPFCKKLYFRVSPPG